MQNKIFYNQTFSEKLGWIPQWFGQEDFNESLIESIKKFQKENKLKEDGVCGPDTYRRIVTEIEASKYLSDLSLKDKGPLDVIDSNIPIEWPKLVNKNHPDALWAPLSCFKLNSSRTRKPKIFVVHWDAALSSKSCYDILKKRNLSVHFMIDNDGTIFQSVMTQHIAQHAGSVNYNSIGVEISNAVELKYQKYYTKTPYGARPILNNVTVHKKNYGNILDFYQVQKDALKALIKSVCNFYNIPLKVPVDNNGKYITTFHKPAFVGDFSGVVCHFHVDPSKKKWDCAGLNLQEIVES